jgi:hypothetical protein
VLSVTFDGPGELCLPESDVCLWAGGIPTTFVTVPEAPVNKYGRPVFWKDYVRLSGQTFNMIPAPISFLAEDESDNFFRSGILAANLRHVVATLFGGVDINHISNFKQNA